jgi:hypothetical protein
MRPTLAYPRRLLPAGAGGASREGRLSELSRRNTALLLFPHRDGRPGPWLLLLASVFTFIGVRVLELGIF